MSSKHNPQPEFVARLSLALTTALIAVAPSAHANVYATNLKLNGSTTNITTLQGAAVRVGYILNEPASAGVAINIYSGSNLVRTITLAGGAAGTTRGTNTVLWDAHDNGSNSVPPGIYSISVTASARGYTNWTKISSDTNAGNYVNAPRAIAVNTLTNSPYYGRVLVGNAAIGPNPAQVPGDNDGIIKCNADGSFADEGAFNNNGYAWSDDGFYASPLKLRVGQDDRVYGLDFNALGKIIALDMVGQTGQVVLDLPNYINNPYFGNLYGWGVMDVTDAGTTNGRVWLGDIGPNSSIGVWAWQLTNGIADPNDDTGTLAVQAAPGSDLLTPSAGFMVDANTNVFVGQERDGGGDTTSRVLLFTNWNGATALTSATWAAGASDDSFRFNYDLTIDSRANPRLVASAMYNGFGIRLLNATNGAAITNLNSTTSYRATAWDNVGNLYAVADGLQRWQVFSPPGGTNRATTVALATIQVTAAQPPLITSISISNGVVTIDFTGVIGDLPSGFIVKSASTVNGTYTPASGVNIIQVGPGVFRATLPTSGPTQFFRLQRQS